MIKKAKKIRAKYKSFRPRIRSRHPSHSDLRSRNGQMLPLMPFRAVIRFGSKHEYSDTIEKGGDRVELNSVESITNSSNKLLMKTCFTNDEVITPDWWTFKKSNDPMKKSYFAKNNDTNFQLEILELPFPIISKHIYGSRGVGNKKHNTLEALTTWLESKNDTSKYIFEKYYSYNREYRLHISENGCFYTCRKMLKTNTEDKKRWYRNNDNCVWLLEDNPLFDRPVNWDNIVKECVKALKSIELDFGAVDLRIQSSKNKKEEVRDNPKFTIIEINSAPSFGDITKMKYINEIPKLLDAKWQKILKQRREQLELQ